MKKYFMKGTDDVVNYGDIIELDGSVEDNGVIKHRHLECKFVPELVTTLIEEEIIEEKEVGEDNNNPSNYDNLYPDMEELLKEFENISNRLKKLEEKTTIIASTMAALTAKIVKHG